MTRPIRRLSAIILFWSIVAGCGRASSVTTTADDPAFGVSSSALSSTNGMTANGLSRNGLSQNGLSQNGLSQNGLSQNGLSTTGFSAWFNQDVALGNAVMKYVYKCAAPAGATLSWRDPATNVTYSWSGLLGLAPGWASGKPVTIDEQQIITACLAAHVNKFGISIPLSVLGNTATGVALPYTAAEISQYSVQEACFFGDLFAGDGAFVGLDHKPLSFWLSTARACGFDDHQGVPNDCPPLLAVGACSKLCTKAKSSDPYYSSCTYNGKTYKPITTRLAPDVINECGDGVCQISEHCGSGLEYYKCKDCGNPCPTP